MPLELSYPPPRIAANSSPAPLATFITTLSFGSTEACERIGRVADLYPQASWRDASAGEIWLGLGAADEMVAHSAEQAWELADRCRNRLVNIRAPLPAHGFLRYFGGIAFDPEEPPHPDWTAGGRGRFFLPRILVCQKDDTDTARVAVTLETDGTGGDEELLGKFRTAIADLRLWSETRATAGHRCDFRTVSTPESRIHWESSVRSALDAIAEGRIRKIVLSRDFGLDAEMSFSPWEIMRRIHSRQEHGFAFSLRFDPSATFLGITPERLIAERGGNITCDCLAGTGPRGRTAEEDETLARALRQSEKDQREHRFVRDGILDSLMPVSRWLTARTKPSVLYLPRLQHLSTRVHGRLRDGTTVGELIRRLHPTPAVGGYPRDAAWRMIRELEARPRGWYAGPVGWISADAADFAVAIRSATVSGGSLRVTGGAGIVRGSDPAAEWDETARKVRSFLSFFTEAEP